MEVQVKRCRARRGINQVSTRDVWGKTAQSGSRRCGRHGIKEDRYQATKRPVIMEASVVAGDRPVQPPKYQRALLVQTFKVQCRVAGVTEEHMLEVCRRHLRRAPTAEEAVRLAWAALRDGKRPWLAIFAEQELAKLGLVA